MPSAKPDRHTAGVAITLLLYAASLLEPAARRRRRQTQPRAIKPPIAPITPGLPITGIPTMMSQIHVLVATALSPFAFVVRT